MSKKLAAAFIISLVIGAYAFNASAVVTQSISHRSAIQNECIKENPEDHKGYLACIKSKREEQKKSAESKVETVKQPENTPSPNKIQ